MRLALLCLLLAACPANRQVTPFVEDAQKRLGIRCEDKRGMLLCGASGDPLQATIFYRSEEDVKTARISSMTITLETASAEIAFDRLTFLLEGFIPAAQFEGIRTRISGPTAEKFDQNKPAVVIDGVDVRSGTLIVDPKRPRFQVEVWYR